MDIDEGSEPWTESVSSGEQDMDTDTNQDSAFKKWPWCKEWMIYMKDTW